MNELKYWKPMTFLRQGRVRMGRHGSVWPMLCGGVAIVVAGYGLFLASHGLAGREAPADVSSTARAPLSDVDTMVARLAERVQGKPATDPAWAMLARSYAALGKFREAAMTCSPVSEATSDVDLLVDCVDIQVMSESGRYTTEARAVLNRALVMAPDHPKALALAGAEAAGRGDAAGARRHWVRALAGVPRDSALAGAVSGWIVALDRRNARPGTKSQGSGVP